MSWWKRDWFFCLILAVVTMLAYQPAWNGGFLWDDDCQYDDSRVAFPGWFEANLVRAKDNPAILSSSLYFLWLQQRFWGDSPTGYHLVNLLLHIGCAVLVLKILRVFADSREQSWLQSLCAASGECGISGLDYGA